MAAKFEILHEPSFMIVFAYAPAGFGHLRVTNALYHGLPKDVTPILLGAQDKSIRMIHRLISIHPVTRRLMQWAQAGVPELLFTHTYRLFLKRRTKLLYEQITTLLDQRMHVPHTVLVIATHFGLAHQLAAIKKKLAQDRNIRIILVVQVTDDSPQYIWYVPNADLIFVPSHYTKKQLISYGKKTFLPKVNFEVIPYPISPVLVQPLSKNDYENRIHQVSESKTAHTHIAIPISGAAVGMPYITSLIDHLSPLSKRWMFHVITKHTPYTQSFLHELEVAQNVQLYAASHDREVVDTYEMMYQNHTISLEITKPSEQAFKALCAPTQTGGSLLLFSQPVGQQEYDNLQFLMHHNLLPTTSQQKLLWEYAKTNTPLSNTQNFEKHATHWRGLVLPKQPQQAARVIWWCFQQGIFEHMMHFTHSYEGLSQTQRLELQANGVEQFWRHVTFYVEEVLKTNTSS